MKKGLLTLIFSIFLFNSSSSNNQEVSSGPDICAAVAAAKCYALGLTPGTEDWQIQYTVSYYWCWAQQE